MFGRHTLLTLVLRQSANALNEVLFTLINFNFKYTKMSQNFDVGRSRECKARPGPFLQEIDFDLKINSSRRELKKI